MVGDGVTRWTSGSSARHAISFSVIAKDVTQPDWPDYISNIASRGFVSISWASCSTIWGNCHKRTAHKLYQIQIRCIVELQLSVNAIPSDYYQCALATWTLIDETLVETAKIWTNPTSSLSGVMFKKASGKEQPCTSAAEAWPTTQNNGNDNAVVTTTIQLRFRNSKLRFYGMTIPS